MQTLKLIMTLCLELFPLCGFLASVSVLCVSFHLAFVRKVSPIYIISSFNLFSDCLQCLLSSAYLVPCIITGSYLFPGGRDGDGSHFMGGFFLYCWYSGSLAMLIMAINRLFVICFSHLPIFTYERVRTLMLSMFPICFVMAIISQYLTPCCKLSFDPAILSISYIEKGNLTNYSNLYIDVPLNFSTSAVCAVCYGYIIYFVRKANSQMSDSVDDATKLKRRMKEYAYAVQFLILSVFYLFAWTAFRTFPMIIDPNSPELYSLVVLNVYINCSANAYIYLLTNKEVRGTLKKWILKAQGKSANYSISQVSTVSVKRVSSST